MEIFPKIEGNLQWYLIRKYIEQKVYFISIKIISNLYKYLQEYCYSKKLIKISVI